MEQFFAGMSLLPIVLCDSFVAAQIVEGPASPARPAGAFAGPVKPSAQLERHFIRFPGCEPLPNDSKQAGIS
jgi:hypothetical protein